MMYVLVGFFLLLMSGMNQVAAMQKYAQEYVAHPERIELLYNAGVEAARTKNYDDAHAYFACLTNLTQQDHSNALTKEQLEQLWYNKGNAAYQIKEYDAALQAFEKVIEYNSSNELAQQKIDYLKKRKEQQEEKKQKDDQDQQKQDNDKGQDNDQQNNKEQDNKEEEHDSSDKNGDDNQNEQQDEQKGDQKEKQKSPSESDQPEKTEEQQKQQGKDQQPKESVGDDQQKTEEIPLSEQEKRILAAVQQLDEQMQKELEKQELRKARGNPYAYNNW